MTLQNSYWNAGDMYCVHTNVTLSVTSHWLLLVKWLLAHKRFCRWHHGDCLFLNSTALEWLSDVVWCHWFCSLINNLVRDTNMNHCLLKRLLLIFCKTTRVINSRTVSNWWSLCVCVCLCHEAVQLLWLCLWLQPGLLSLSSTFIYSLLVPFLTELDPLLKASSFSFKICSYAGTQIKSCGIML